MEVALDKRYPLAVSIDQAWAVLCDIRSTAGCMPGASITEQIDETHFKGSVRSKVGPAVMTFGGDIEVLGRDEAARQLRMMGKGSDKAGSSASMDLTANLEAGATPGSCVLVGHAAIIVNGKLAQFGSRLLVPVADMMLAQFAKNFEASAATVPAVATAAAPVASAGALAGPTEAAAIPVTPKPMPTFQPAKELNVLAFGWALFKSWIGGLFGKRA
jgi:carbon monoxide dehydrogenase subunit G